jgi:hypothetical protein
MGYIDTRAERDCRCDASGAILAMACCNKIAIVLQYLGAGGMGVVDAGRAVPCDWRLGWWLPEPKVETREPRV